MVAKQIQCPNCGKPTVYDVSNPARPFCSDRCKLIDLGEWASEKYGVPGEMVSPDASPESKKQDEDDDGEV